MIGRHPALQVRGTAAESVMDDVIVEESITIFLNGEFVAEQVASPDFLKELGAGFVICEGLASRVTGVEVSGTEIWVQGENVERRALELRSSGGFGSSRPPRTVYSSLTITPEDIYDATRLIVSETWKKTGGVHCSVLLSPTGLIAEACDIGRHNTVDKVVGAAELAGVDRSRCFLCCTGRQPTGMVSKSANAGIPIIISRSATTDRGILTAEYAGITLICFSRENRFTVYANPERIRGLTQPETI
jgi:FdhD protein